MTVDTSTLDATMKEIERRYGGGSVHKGDVVQPVQRIPTGSLELDYAFGGGIPIGRWSHLWGGYSAGKTLAVWRAIREAQKMGMLCAYYNIEKQYDPQFAADIGVDTKKLIVVQGATIEGIGEKLEGLLGAVHFHALDSLTAAVSVDELDAKLVEWRIGLAARAWGKVIRRINERFDETEHTIVMINQARDDFTGNERPPGGRIIDHTSSLTVHFRRGKWLFYDGNGVLSTDNKQGSMSGVSGDVEPAGYEQVVRVGKSRVGTPLRTARLRYDFAGRSLDTAYEVTKAAIYFDVVKNYATGRYELPDGTKVHGEKNLRAAITPELTEQVRDKMLQAA